MINNTKIKDYVKSILYPINDIERYFTVYDNFRSSYVPFLLLPKQIEVFNSLNNNQFNLIVKSRQCGVSSITDAYLAKKSVYLDDINKPEVIVLICNRLDLATHHLKIIKNFILEIPRSHWGEEYNGSPDKEKKSIFIRETQQLLVLPNGSKIVAAGPSRDLLRGFEPTKVVFDEAAFINNGLDIFNIIIRTLGKKGQIIIQSTPNGFDDFFYKIYDDVISGNCYFDFKIIECKWYNDLRYNSDLKWSKNGENLPEELLFNETYESLNKKGWKLTSPWYEEMCMNLNHSEIKQHLDALFI
jgi:hypothetical protein